MFEQPKEYKNYTNVLKKLPHSLSIVNKPSNGSGNLKSHNSNKASQEKEEKLKQQAAFVNNNPAPVLMSNKECIIIDANPSAKEIYGSEIIGSKLNTIFIEWDETLSLDLKQNHFVQFEDIKNGKTFLFTVKEDVDTNAYYLYGSDISDKKRAEEELIESEGKFKSLVQNSSIGIYRSNKAGEIIFANPALLHMLGYKTIEEMRKEKRAIDLYVNPEEREIFQSILEDEGTIFDFETELRKKDGTEIIVKECSKIIKNLSDKDIIYQGVIQDITQTKLMDEAIRENEERFRVTTDASGDVFYRLNFKGMQYEYIHPNIEKLTGYSPEEINLSKIVLKIERNNKPIDVSSVINNLKKHPEESLELNYLIKTKNGELKWIADRPYSWYDDLGKLIGSMGILTDLTERKKIEEELTEAKEYAERSNQMKSEFIAQMSHEVRTPINIILSFIELMKDDLKEKISEEEFDNLNIIHLAGKRLIRTVESIMNFSEISSGNYEPIEEDIDLYGDVLKRIYNEYQESAEEKSLKFTLLKSVKNKIIKADKYSIIQIFSHLIDNSIKYTEKGNVEISLTSTNGKLKVKIIDTGIGISDKFLSKIFEPFTQEYHGYSRKFEGNGIGLALVKKYCDLNNIDIKVDSIKEKGTTVQLTFNNSKVELN